MRHGGLARQSVINERIVTFKVKLQVSKNNKTRQERTNKMLRFALLAVGTSAGLLDSTMDLISSGT